jgi:hypothetical protein
VIDESGKIVREANVSSAPPKGRGI